MTFTPVSLLHVSLVQCDDQVPVGRLAHKDRRLFFEYDPAFIARGIDLSPFKLAVRSGVFSNQDGLFDGLFGLFSDSLPDGWGRLLLDRQMRQRGIAPERLTALDRLAHVGHHGMGALCYTPDYSELPAPSTGLDLDHLADESRAVLAGETSDVLTKLLALNGASAGARPKIMAAVSPDKKHLAHGVGDIVGDQQPWIIKFAAIHDSPDIGAVEYAYSLMARAAGVDMPETHLFTTGNGRGYFGVRRFDRDQRGRRHMHTVSGLLHADHRMPSLDYDSILKATLHLTKSMPDVEAMFRLAVFNVMAHNRDDHAKNFSFLMSPDGTWHAAPAYDLTFSSGPGGEHSTMVMGEGKLPGPADLQKLGKKIGIARPGEIMNQVRETIAHWNDFADQAGASRESRQNIAAVILPP